MKTYTVEFVYGDEATPRELNYKTVKAADTEDAKMIVVMEASINGDRVMTTGILTDSRH